MDLSEFLVIDINIMAAAVMITLVAVIKIREAGTSYSTKLFLGLCFSTILVIFLESLAWLIDGLPGRSGFYLVYLSNFFLLLFTPLPAVAWLCYMDYMIFGSTERLKKRLFYLVPFFLCLLMMVFSIPSGFAFTIDAANAYHRGPGFVVIAVINYSLLFLSVFIVIRHRDTVEKRVLSIVLFFSLLPAVGGILQMRYFGTVLIWPSLAIGILLTFLFLEIQKEIRDYLTGLLTRQQIDELVKMRIDNYEKKGNFTLLMVDMDGFKEINDNYGHEAGDQALISMSYSLVRSVKRTDKAARFGGDEFLVLLEVGKEDIVAKVLERLRESVCVKNEMDDKPYSLKYSAGYAIYDPAVHKNFNELFHAADAMMYDAKRKKNR